MAGEAINNGRLGQDDRPQHLQTEPDGCRMGGWVTAIDHNICRQSRMSERCGYRRRLFRWATFGVPLSRAYMVGRGGQPIAAMHLNGAPPRSTLPAGTTRTTVAIDARWSLPSEPPSHQRPPDSPGPARTTGPPGSRPAIDSRCGASGFTAADSATAVPDHRGHHATPVAAADRTIAATMPRVTGRTSRTDPDPCARLRQWTAGTPRLQVPQRPSESQR
jgi:hypothetical protein